MNFLTQEEVKIAAEKGELPALECSLRHHQEGRDADYVELRDAIEKGHFNIDAELCACCVYAHDIAAKEGKSKCDYCPLEVAEESCCCDGKWLSTCQAFLILIYDYSNANFKTFQDAESKLCTYIGGVLEKKRAEEKKPEKCDNCKHWEKGKTNPCFNCDLFKHFEPKESTPALRHGDYGYCKSYPNQLRFFVKTIGGDIKHYQETPCSIDPCSCCPEGTYAILGNVFDDIKAGENAKN